MSELLTAKKRIIAPILDNNDFMYALKHQQDGLLFQGIWQCDQYRKGKLIGGGYPEAPNIFCTEGIGRMLTVYFHDIAKAAEEIFFVGLFLSNITPVAADTSAKLGSGNAYGEAQDSDYDDPLTDKPAYTTEDTSIATITNAVAGKAHFVMANSVTVYGAFLSTEKAKTAVTGYLTAAKRFSASRAVIDDDELDVTYEINVTSS